MHGYPDRVLHRNKGAAPRTTAEMYVADPRFAATYERVQPGLATFLRDAIRIRAGLAGA